MKKIAFFLLLFLGSKVATAQCAMCRAVLETQEGQTAAEGINNGIVYLMAIPYILVFVIGYVVYKKMKQ